MPWFSADDRPNGLQIPTDQRESASGGREKEHVMLALIRRHLAANLVGYLALLVATSGTAYAVATVTGADVVNDSLTGRDVKESSLAQVPKALLNGKRVTYQVTQPAGSLAPVKFVDFRNLELRLNCASVVLNVASLEARSTVGNAVLTWYATSGEIGGNLSASVEQHGQSLPQGEWELIDLISPGERVLFELYFRFPGGIVTAELVMTMVQSGDDNTCKVDGILGGV